MAASRTRTALIAAGVLTALFVLGYRFLAERGTESGAKADAQNRGATRAARTGPTVPTDRTRGERVIVRGVISDLLTGQAVPGIGVSLRPDVAGGPTSGSGPVTSDQAGRYQLAVVPGRYRVHVSVPALAAYPEQTVTIPRTGAAYDVDIQVLRMAHVAGRVVDQDGEPVAGARVAYQRPDSQPWGEPDDGRAGAAQPSTHPLATGLSDRDGGFELLVPPGEIALHAHADNRPESHTTLRWVEPGAELSGVEIVMDAGADIAGEVVDTVGTRVPGATVHARADDQHEPRRVTTDDDGRFALRAIRPGRLIVWAQASGLAPSSPAVVELRPGERNDALRLVLSIPAEIRGRVVDDTGRLCADIDVRAESAMIRGVVAETRTDSSGRFTLAGLAAAPYVLIATGQGVASARVDGVTAPAGDIEIVLARTGTVSGQVVGAGGAPLTDFWVRLDRRANPAAQANDTMIPYEGADQRFLSEDGQYLVEAVRPGSYDVTFFARGLAAHTVVGIQVPAGGEAHASAALGPGGAIRGTVTDRANQQPVRGAAVRLSTGSEHPTVYTDADGQFTIPDIAVGRRSVEVRHPSYVEQIATGIEVGDGDDIRGDGPQTVAIALERLSFGAERTVEFAGIGAVLAMEDGFLRVREVIRNGPSEVAGLRAGDGISHTDGVPTGERSMAENIESIRGIVGTVVRVTVVRGDQHFVRDVVRAAIRFKPDDPAAGSEPEPDE